MHSEDLHSGQALLATRGRFTMVALDDRGRPTPVPPMRVSSASTEDAQGA
jgi:acyl-CoA hydrolase